MAARNGIMASRCAKGSPALRDPDQNTRSEAPSNNMPALPPPPEGAHEYMEADVSDAAQVAAAAVGMGAISRGWQTILMTPCTTF